MQYNPFLDGYMSKRAYSVTRRLKDVLSRTGLGGVLGGAVGSVAGIPAGLIIEALSDKEEKEYLESALKGSAYGGLLGTGLGMAVQAPRLYRSLKNVSEGPLLDLSSQGRLLREILLRPLGLGEESDATRFRL